MERTGFRLVVALLALVVAVAAAIAFLVAARFLEPAQLSVGSLAIEEALDPIYDGPLATRVVFMIASPLVGLVSLVVGLRSLGGLGSRANGLAVHVLDSDDKGFVVVDSRGIAIVAEEAAHTARGVVSAEVTVTPRAARQVKLRVDIDVYPGANVKQAGNEARSLVQKAVEEMVGVEVTSITASTHVLEPEEMARALI